MEVWSGSTKLHMWLEGDTMASALGVAKHTFLRIEVRCSRVTYAGDAISWSIHSVEKWRGQSKATTVTSSVYFQKHQLISQILWSLFQMTLTESPLSHVAVRLALLRRYLACRQNMLWAAELVNLTAKHVSRHIILFNTDAGFADHFQNKFSTLLGSFHHVFNTRGSFR